MSHVAPSLVLSNYRIILHFDVVLSIVFSCLGRLRLRASRSEYRVVDSTNGRRGFFFLSYT